MESRVFWFTVMCMLCIDAIGESMCTKVFAPINNIFQVDARTEETQTERLIHMQTRPVETTWKDDTFESEILNESPRVKDLSVKMKIFSKFENARCSRYCIGQLETGKDNPFEDINLFWSFAGSKNETDQFSLESSPKLKISKFIDKSLTDSDNNCQIYLYLSCGIINMERNSTDGHEKVDSNIEINRESTEFSQEFFRRNSSEFLQKEKLVHKAYLSGYTETKFYVDANITEIIFNIRGNLTRAVLAIPTNRTMRRSGITMSLARTYDMKGVVIGARNPPPGGWVAKLAGVENSKYNFDVTGYFGASEENNTRDEIIDVKSVSEFKEDLDRMLNRGHISQNEATVTMMENFNQFNKETCKDIANERVGDSMLLIKSNVSKKPKYVFERSAEIVNTRTSTDAAMTDDFSNASLSSLEATAMKDIINNSALPNHSLASHGNIEIPQKVSNRTIFGDRMLALLREQEQKIDARSSEVASLNENDMNVKPFASNNVSMKIIQNQEARLAGNSKEDIFARQKILIEVNPESSLLAVPGRIHTIFFDLTNNCVLTVRYAVRATSSSFRIYNIRPPYVWLYPGQTNYVAVDVVVPAGIRQDTINTLTLFVDGTEISEKTVYLYVQDSSAKITDNVKPTIEYSFNSNCAGNLNKGRCEKTFWSADITIQDSDSGLKSVTSTPNKIYPRTDFISGTKNSVTFYYLSTCCSTIATVTATDLLNNQHSRNIDVTEWDNLSQGEIAAIVVGALFLLFLLILLIVAIVYCVRKRNGHDLPYTQRYGSRPPARSERTSF
ncbi:PREDICTED: uncharacterized protein LOC106749772 isoform X2 [Dinoponera quadriceps]|uniref:Uncharacterized protein LOC106749772 isoform X2 n=1 Tax=Dinoponera quadriceps TaxID=609295 RepID=A0A6P3Y4L4_DINQU|nr:PREDICTED: uncharacterized protein LOC106749772 isoform X2 [Dinoponera quadriceps]